MPKAENQELYKQYERLAIATPDVRFVGRLATFRRIQDVFRINRILASN